MLGFLDFAKRGLMECRRMCSYAAEIDIVLGCTVGPVLDDGGEGRVEVETNWRRRSSAA